MPTKKNRTSLSGYFEALNAELKTQTSTLTRIISHYGEMGFNDHQWLAELIRQYLPSKFGVDTGFVVNSQSDTSDDKEKSNAYPSNEETRISPQIDILLLDTLHNAPLCNEKSFRVCPIEMVLGAIEVTRNLTKTKLKQDLEKLAHTIS